MADLVDAELGAADTLQMSADDSVVISPNEKGETADAQQELPPTVQAQVMQNLQNVGETTRMGLFQKAKEFVAEHKGALLVWTGILTGGAWFVSEMQATMDEIKEQKRKNRAAHVRPVGKRPVHTASKKVQEAVGHVMADTVQEGDSEMR